MPLVENHPIIGEERDFRMGVDHASISDTSHSNNLSSLVLIRCVLHTWRHQTEENTKINGR